MSFENTFFIYLFFVKGGTDMARVDFAHHRKSHIILWKKQMLTVFRQFYQKFKVPLLNLDFLKTITAFLKTEEFFN